MKTFKLLAIRPLQNCDKRFLKNLQKGTIYKFYTEYTYLDVDDNQIETGDRNVVKVTFEKSIPYDLYNTDDLTINVSALVGKNGSGKSSLLELFYASCYVIASRKQILKDNAYYMQLFEESENRDIRFIKLAQEIESVYDDLNVEFFYQIGNCIYGVRLEAFNIYHFIIKGSNDKFIKNNLYPNNPEFAIYQDNEQLDSNLRFVFNDVFFYTISINYSLYGLNDKILGNWATELFHKNDGYQTPLVVNPFRREGNIDVNSELHLAQTRLFTNILLSNNKEILYEKEIDTIVFQIDTEKYVDKIDENLDLLFDNFKKERGLDNVNFFTDVYNSLYGGKEYGNISPFTTPRPNFEYLVKYLFRKIIKISQVYSEYDGDTLIENDKVVFANFFTFLSKLKEDKSHITLKLRQTLNIIRFNILSENEQTNDYEIWSNDDKGNFFFRIKIDRLIARINALYEDKFSYEEVLPIGCYNTIIWVANNKNDVETISNLDILSSGEQHLLHSIQSILYHILNINSVWGSKTQKIKYQYINVILDEIELYFHPEFQRIFLFALRNKIKNLKIDNIKGLNIIFCTHSPFILSDIPKECTLKLEEGSIKPSFRENTFGANIHDLLDDDFYLKNGFMGEFAKNKILSLINYLDEEKEDIIIFENYSWNKENSLEFINIVGEPILQSTLKELYYKKFNDEIDKEIERLTRLKSGL